MLLVRGKTSKFPLVSHSVSSEEGSVTYAVGHILGDKFTVLVVDDDPGNLETMTDILNEMNFKVSTASDGYQAIEMMKRGSFDAVMMDLRMPGIDGIETLRRIKVTKPDAKVILMTAYASEATVLAARREGASTVLYKPIDLDTIEALLREKR